MTELEKFVELKETQRKNKEKKIRIEERLKTESENLKKLMAEITAAGYDPKKIKETLAGKEKEFKEKMDSFEADVKKVSEELAKIED